MLEFLGNCLSFPVNIFSGLLIICFLYWLVAALGLVDADSLDLDADTGADLGDLGDAGGEIGEAGALDGHDLGPEVGGHGAQGLGAFSSLLFYLGLYGVPMTLIITFIAIFGWLIAYYGFHWGLGVLFEPGFVRYALGAVLFVGALLGSVLLTSLAIKPFRPLFRKERQVTNASLCGSPVLVRSSQVTDSYGEAVCQEGGSGMLVDVRPAHEGQVFQRGDRAVILDYDPVRHLYTIISEDEFQGR